MKKLLIASTALTLLAGAAAADTTASAVTLSGYGWAGLGYYSKAPAGTQKTFLYDRLNLDLGISKTTDSGLTFHGKFRIRSQRDTVGHGLNTTAVNGGQVGVTAGGFDVSVGNVADALDASSLYYNANIGLAGDQYTNGGDVAWYSKYIGYSSYGGGANGILATYTAGGLVIRGSIEDPGYPNTFAASGKKKEYALGVNYTMGTLAFEGNYVKDSGGNSGVDIYEAGVQYGMGNANVGFLAGHTKNAASISAPANTFTLYGNTTFGATTVAAFVSRTTSAPVVATKTSFGVGASYDLGSGASVIGSLQRDFAKATFADLGVKFKF